MKCEALALALAGAAAGCYHPNADQACAITCPCPDSLVCGADQLCHAPGAPECSTPDAAMPRDDGGDSGGTSSDGGCYGTLLGVHLCAIDPASRSYPTDSTTIDSDNDCTYTFGQLAGPTLCVVAASSITIDGAVRMKGSRPLVLFATGAITVTASGDVDVSGADPKTHASGADFTCNAMTLDGATAAGTTQGGGGGAGGTFQTAGGTGGKGVTTSGGNVATEPALSFVRGGCRGGAGGKDASNSAGGVSGASGGAVDFVAGQSITILGAVHASGGGGDVSGNPQGESGGGGGASGGLVVLDAPAVTVQGVILALGGSGAGGCGGPQEGSQPTAGATPTSTAGVAGGNGGGIAGRGGASSSANSVDGSAGTDGVGLVQSGGAVLGTGGGGGGGGDGYIVVRTGFATNDTNVAPAPTAR